MTPILHEYAASGNCYKIRLTAALLGLPLERREYDIMKGETRTPEFLANVNANGRIPVLQIGDRFLPESNAACFYLAEGSALVPEEGSTRADMLRWMFWEQYNHEPNVATLRFWRGWVGEENLSDAQRAHAPGQARGGRGGAGADGRASRRTAIVSSAAGSASPTSRSTPTPMSRTRAASISRDIRGSRPGWRGSPLRPATSRSRPDVVSRIILAAMVLFLAVNFALTDRSWSLVSAPRISPLGVLEENPALAELRRETEASRQSVSYPEGATPPEIEGRQPLKAGIAYRELSLFGMPFFAQAEPGLITYIERPGDMQALPLSPDQAAALDAATGYGYSEVRFAWWTHMWGWLLVLLIVLWVKARSIEVRRAEERELQGGRGIAERVALQLAGRGLGQRLDELDLARIFVGRDRRLDMVLQRARRAPASGAWPGGEDDEGLHLLAALLAGHADHRAFLHRRMGVERILHLGRGDIVAGRDDHVVGAGDVPEIALLVLAVGVAGDVPAVDARNRAWRSSSK